MSFMAYAWIEDDPGSILHCVKSICGRETIYAGQFVLKAEACTLGL